LKILNAGVAGKANEVGRPAQYQSGYRFRRRLSSQSVQARIFGQSILRRVGAGSYR
jgi:hypothetical protein